MRWENLSAKEPDASAARAVPPLPLALPGAVARTFDTPGFAGITFYEVRAKSIINRVPAVSRVPFEWTINPYRGCSHACVYCLAGDTPILMADGRTKPLSDLRTGDRIYGTVRVGAYRRLTITEVRAHWSTVKRAYRIRLVDGTELVASGDHRFLTERGWKHVVGAGSGALRRPHLTPGDKLMGTEALLRTQQYLEGSDVRTTEFALSPATPQLRAMTAIRTSARVSVDPVRDLIRWPDDPCHEWRAGLLAGIFDAEGCYSGGIMRISSTDPEIISRVRLYLADLAFDPAITRKRAVEGTAIETGCALGVVSVEPLNVDLPMYDITTGTGDFIANGVVSHNCFARNTHTYLDFDAGHDFDTRVIVKVNAGTLLRKELAAPRWSGAHIAMGTNVDCYQRAEGRYRLMREILAALRDYANPFSILTKGTLILRDLDLLQQAAQVTRVSLSMSIGFVDETLWRAVEPGTPAPRRRLDAVRRLTDAGFAVGVLVAPILPGLSDDDASIEDTVAAIAAAGACSATPLPLHLRPGAREWYLGWLGGYRPDLARRYSQLFRGGSYSPKDYQRDVCARVRAVAGRYGIGVSEPGEARRVLPPEPPAVEQLRLL